MIVDIHAHYFPRTYNDLLVRFGGRSLPEAARALTARPMRNHDRSGIPERFAQMDDAGVRMQVLSPAASPPYAEKEADAVEAARLINDSYAELAQRYPGRFSAVVSLPLPHIDAALREMERGLDRRGMLGVSMTCSCFDRSTAPGVLRFARPIPTRGVTVRPNKIKQIWRDGRVVTMGWLSISHGFTAEVMARQGFDALVVDMQHGLTDMNDVWPMLQAISQTDTVPVVRVPWNDPATIMKVLDFGAYGVLVPLINTPEDAAKAVAACRYPPVGMRSSGPVRAVHYGGADYVAKANDEIVVMGMIETKEGLTNLDAICATPGLDAVYIGPSDLAFALGMAPRGDNPDPLHKATCDKIRDAAHKHGIKACMHTASAAYSADAVKRGFDLVMLTSDLASMVAGVRRQLDDLKAATA